MIYLLTCFLSLATAAPCEPELTPVPWSTLPEIAEHPLPERFVTALNRHPLTTVARRLYGEGESLYFDFSQTIHETTNGWGIQAHFLRLVLAAWLPKSTIFYRHAETRTRVRILIVDSRLSSGADDQELEMNNLKVANPGLALPPRSDLRKRMGLAKDARIASFYASWTHEKQVPELVNALIADHLADLVLLSTQSGSSPEWHRFDDGNVEGVPYFTSAQYGKLGAAAPGRAIVFNLTRGRMPYVHAVSDYAVVLGAANGAEPLYQGRPTYVTRSLRLTEDERRWDRWVEDLTTLGGAHAFGDAAELTKLIRDTADLPTPEPMFEHERILGRLLSQLLDLIERSNSRRCGDGT